MPTPRFATPLRRVLSCSGLALFVALSASLPLACDGSGATCGPGTEEISGQCRPLANGAAGAGTGGAGGSGIAGRAGGPSNAGAAGMAGGGGTRPSGLAPANVTRVSLRPVDGILAQADVVPVALGVPTTFVLVGGYEDGSGGRLSNGVTFTTPDDPDVTLTVKDGYATVVVRRVGDVSLTGSANTPQGMLVALRQLRVSPPKALSLNVVTLPTGSWDAPRAEGNYLDNVLETSRSSGAAPGRAAAGSALRVVTALEYDVTVAGVGKDAPDKDVHGRVVLEPATLAFEASAGTVDAAATLRSDTTGDVEVSVRHTLVGPGGAELTGTGQARFVAPSPAIGLVFAGSRVLPPKPPFDHPVYDAPAGSFSIESFTNGTLGIPNPQDGDTPLRVDLVALEATADYPYSFTVAVAHGTGEDAYFEELPWSDVSFELLAGAETLGPPPSAVPDGRFLSGKPGVAAFVLQAAGFALPGLVTMPYPPLKGLPSVELRAAPSSLTIPLPAPGDPDACASVDLFAKPSGEAERALSPLETLVVRRFAEDVSVIHDVETGKRVTELCVSSVSNKAGKGKIRFQFLGGTTVLGLEL